METINNVASAAAKAVWGSPETKQEPVSGVKGNTAEGEPYDAGNMEPHEVSSTTKPLDRLDGEKHTEHTEHTTQSSGTQVNVAESSKTGPSADVSSVKPESSTSPIKPETSQEAKLDGSDRPEEQVVDVDLSKPGPKPLETLAREHGGDAGRAAEHTKPTGPSTLPDDPKGDKSQEGTGEKVVKSTGFAAEGGDFDAAAAGAAREADRLLDENNPQTNSDPASSKSGHGAAKSDLGGSGAGGEKLSLKEKIKAKLHKH